jgi:alpha-beta hydrolase superfamily lysophospholipase
MTATTEEIRADDGVRLAARRWIPDNEVTRAVVQISHGMAEHSGRYGWTAERLTEAGYEVWADDHRGHGETARGGLLGHPADSDGFFRVVRDLELWTDAIAARRPGLPIFLLGHSWGSFLAQAYIERSGGRLAGCALSGTMGPGGPIVAVGAVVATVVAALGGPSRHSPLLRALADGGANAKFKPNRTEFDWTSRDEASVDAYAADPLCGFKCSAAFYRDLARGLLAVHSPAAMDRIPKELPLYVFCGSRDPIGHEGRSPAALVEEYRRRGVRDLEFVLYPDARHETLQETNRNEVAAALVAWLRRHS